MTGPNANRDPDSVLAAWLDEGPTDLPDVTRRAILTALPTIRQARRGPFAPWRSFQMNAFARGAAMVLVAIVAIGTAALLVGPRTVGGPSPSPIPSPISPSPSSTASAAASTPPLPALNATFVSQSYGYQIRYPAGWTISQGHGPWPFGTTLGGPGDPTTDSIVTPGGLDRMRISAASIALPSGTTMEAFRAFASPYSAPFQPDPCTPVNPLAEPVLISYQKNATASPEKVPAVVSINGCDALAELGGFVYDVEVIAGGRGYQFTLDGELTTVDALAWLGSITLEPTKAPTVSAAPSSSASK